MAGDDEARSRHLVFADQVHFGRPMSRGSKRCDPVGESRGERGYSNVDSIGAAPLAALK